MKVDESGAPWPYEDVEPGDEPGVPTWECPDGTCECQSHQGEAARIEHAIVLFDADSKRMAGARCRVLENGELVNVDSPYATGGPPPQDGSDSSPKAGEVTVKVKPTTRVLELEWAPADLPIRPDMPYRTRYYLDLGESPEEALHRRLHNVGFSWEGTDERNLLAFGRAYGLEPAGDLGLLRERLRTFHDEGRAPTGHGETPRLSVPASDARLPRTDGAPPAAKCGSAAPERPRTPARPCRHIVFLGVNKPQATVEATALAGSAKKGAKPGIRALTAITPAGATEFYRTWGKRTTEEWIESIKTLQPGQPQSLLEVLKAAPNESPIGPGSTARRPQHYHRYEIRALAKAFADVEAELRSTDRCKEDGGAGVACEPMKRLVLSAHHRPAALGYWIGWLYSYNYLYIHIDDIASLATVFPSAAAQVEDVFLGACNTGHYRSKPEPFRSWTVVPRFERMFRNLQTVWAYEATAPGGRSAADELVAWEVASRGPGAKEDIVEAARRRRFTTIGRATREGWRSIVWTREGATLVPRIQARPTGGTSCGRDILA